MYFIYPSELLQLVTFKFKPFLFRHHQPYAPNASLNDKNNAFLDILLLIKNIYKKMLHARNKTITPLG